MGDTIYSLDDLTLAPDQVKEAQVFRRARVKKDHEIELPTEEREILFREVAQMPGFRNMARQIVEMYFLEDRDYLSQNYYLDQYRNHRYGLSWLVPIVLDQKKVYKKKNVGPMTLLQDGTDLLKSLNGFVNYSNFDQPQMLVESLHNYVSAPPTNARNHLGSHVLRIRGPIESPSDLEDKSKLEFRGSYGTMQGISLEERQKSSNRNLIVGYEEYDQVIGEPLHVVGFAEFPQEFPSRQHENWFPTAKISLAQSEIGEVAGNETEGKPSDGVPEVSGENLDKILKEALPQVEQVIDKYDGFKGITDLRVILRLLEGYGHSIQSLTVSNRKSITEIIETNLKLMKVSGYTRTSRLEYPMLEKELIGERGSGILNKEVLEDSAMAAYGIDFTKFPHLFSQYLTIVRQLDNGGIWLTLINPESTEEEIQEAIRDYRIFVEFREVASSLKTSYFNLVNQTTPNQELYEDISDNPLDNIQESNMDKRDQIAWNRYFKRSYLGKDGISYYWHGKRIGCVHEYDRLYQKFEDPDDQYPYGKKWTEITPFGGIMCGFCGDTIVEDDELVSQGYDSRGQRINTYDNEGLVKQQSNIDVYFQEKTEVMKTAEKMVDLWLEMSQQRLNDRGIRALKYTLIKPYDEILRTGNFKSGLQQNPNKMMKTTNRAFGEWLVAKYEIKNPGMFPTGWFLREKLFPFFYSLTGVYEILIHRLAIFMTVLNWHLVHEDSVYLNSNVLLRMFTQEHVGKYFFIYQLLQRQAFLSLKDPKKDSIQGNFVESAMKIVPRKKKSAQEYQEYLVGMYQENKKKYLYSPNYQGSVFNGDNPLEHEVVEILSAYLVSIGKPSVMDHLENIYGEYWKRMSAMHHSEVSKLEEQNRVSMMGKESLLHKVDSGNRPLYDRFLAGHRVYKLQQLEQIYLDLVNDNIHQIQVDQVTRRVDTSDTSGQSGSGKSGSQVGGHTFCPQVGRSVVAYSETVYKKMVVLNRLNCEDWSSLEELSVGGLESETQRMDAVMTLKTDIAGLERQISAAKILNRPYVPNLGGELEGLPSKSRKFDVYKIFQKAPFGSGAIRYRKMIWAKNFSEPGPQAVKAKTMPKLEVLVDRLKFLVGSPLRAGKMIKSMGELTSMIKKLGHIRYYPEAEEWSRHHHAVVSGQMSGTSQCNTQEGLPPEAMNDFQMQFQVWNENMYVPSKAQLVNLKKYVLTYVRQRIYLLETVTDRETMVKFGLERYLDLFDYDAFNLAFKDFNGGKGSDKSKLGDTEYGGVYSNQEIDDMVQIGLDEETTESDRLKTIDLLIRIFVSDLVRHLDNVRTKAGRFDKSKTRRTTSDQINEGQIFEGFIRILMSEIWETEQVANVNFHHRSINEQIRGKMIFDKFDKAEKKSPLDYTIARLKIQADEEFDQEMNETGGYMPSDDVKADPYDYDAPENDNDEDDLDEQEVTEQ